MVSHIFGVSQAIRTYLLLDCFSCCLAVDPVSKTEKSASLSLVVPVMYNVDTCSTVKGAGMMREDRFSMNIMQIVGHKFY